KSFPKLKAESIRETQAEGIYEVVVTTNGQIQIMYYSPQGYIFTGDMWSKDLDISLTAQRKDEIMAARGKDLQLDKALKIGNGKKTVIEFIDPQCPFCRLVYEGISKRPDVTQYVFFFPLERIHPKGIRMAKYVLCSDNPGNAFDEVMRGKLDEKELELPPGCDKNDGLEQQIKEGRKIGINGTPAFFINGKFVAGTNALPLVQKLLSH
ncbi:MAG TPA: DsbC family protein, partial [Dissulfurispiraceae bacterium]